MQLRESRLLLSPSDLNNFLACRRRTALDLQLAHGEIELERIPRPDAELVAERGREHEREYRQQLEYEGRQLVEIDTDHGTTVAAVATEGAMRDGADVIFQAAFLDPDGWQGYADFLVRTEIPSDLGPWSYEAYDTKLATHPKPYFVLQLAFYSEQIARLQGWMPKQMHVVLGTKKAESFRYDDFSAYLRRIRRAFLASLGGGATAPYPYPVEHCDYCDWWRECRDKRRADDHTSLVAGLARPQSIKLEEGGVPTVRALAQLPDETRVPRLAAAALAGLHDQARLQVQSRDTGERVREFLPLEHGRGFLRLPTPSEGDVFFDIEGDPFWGREGLEYLLGAWLVDGNRPLYRADWAHDEPGERAAFETWIDWITERRKTFPGLHVYHYNHYEPTALKRLMGKYGTREDELDDLLRGQVFVDLYAVVRQAVRIGEESYGLKSAERFYDFARDAEVTEAGGSILAYQEWLESREQAKLDAIADYNADDCRSTWALREWLLGEREEAALAFGEVLPDRNAVEPRERSEKSLAVEAETEGLQAGLLSGLDPDDDALRGDDRARVLLADLLDYHRREGKPAWWAYFARQALTLDELRDEDTEALGDVSPAEDVAWEIEKKSWLIPLRFPPQQHKMEPGNAVDPGTDAGVKVSRVDEERRLVWIKRGKAVPEDKPLPRALAPGQPYGHAEQQAALRRLATRVCSDGLLPRGELDASCDLLLARAPRLLGGGLDEPLPQVVLALDSSALFVQGPPGSGKTYTGARVIAELLRQGKRVGVTATAHKAIHNVLAELEKVAEESGLEFVGLKKCSDDPETVWETAHIESSSDNGDFEDPDEEVQLLAGTAWLFARAGMAASCDVLVVDEAGQVSLADALVVAQAARSVVLLGDPQQLAHVSQGMHPRGSGVSVLEHLLAGRDTVPPDEGVFLATTYRMHPDVCDFVSTTMYDGRLESEPECADQEVLAEVPLGGTGLRFLAVEHEGNRQSASEEAALIGAEIDRLLTSEARVCAGGKPERLLTLADILVVAPYNAQVRCLQAALPPGARVGTVDKFQGQEAPIVFFSMTSSTGEDVPRGMDFLFSRNRLNVAVSRARCVAAVVASPALLSTVCNTVEQMRLVNALCRFAEAADAH